MRLHGRNFQSWGEFSLDVEGLTCLVGPTNLGKSAVFRAMHAVLRNDLPESFVRRGTKQVTLDFTDDVEIKMSRSDKSSPSYQVGDEKYDKLNQKVPPEIDALGYGSVKVGDLEFDPIFAGQFDQQFGLSWGPTATNQVLGAFASTDKLEQGKKEANRRIAGINSEAKVLATELAHMERQLILCRDLEVRSGIALAQVEEAEGRMAMLDSVRTTSRDLMRLQEDVRHGERLREVESLEFDSVLQGLKLMSALERLLGLLADLAEYERLVDVRGADEEDLRVIFGLAERRSKLGDVLSLKDLSKRAKALGQVGGEAPDLGPELRTLGGLMVLLVPRLDLGLVALGPSPDLRVCTRLSRVLGVRADLADLDDKLADHEDSLALVSQEEREVNKELKALDTIECPECGYKWSEE